VKGTRVGRLGCQAVQNMGTKTQSGAAAAAAEFKLEIKAVGANIRHVHVRIELGMSPQCQVPAVHSCCARNSMGAYPNKKPPRAARDTTRPNMLHRGFYSSVWARLG
jgi:hypothetical protein